MNWPIMRLKLGVPTLRHNKALGMASASLNAAFAAEMSPAIRKALSCGITEVKAAETFRSRCRDHLAVQIGINKKQPGATIDHTNSEDLGGIL